MPLISSRVPCVLIQQLHSLLWQRDRSKKNNSCVHAQTHYHLAHPHSLHRVRIPYGPTVSQRDHHHHHHHHGGCRPSSYAQPLRNPLAGCSPPAAFPAPSALGGLCRGTLTSGCPTPQSWVFPHASAGHTNASPAVIPHPFRQQVNLLLSGPLP